MVALVNVHILFQDSRLLSSCFRCFWTVTRGPGLLVQVSFLVELCLSWLRIGWQPGRFPARPAALERQICTHAPPLHTFSQPPADWRPGKWSQNCWQHSARFHGCASLQQIHFFFKMKCWAHIFVPNIILGAWLSLLPPASSPRQSHVQSAQGRSSRTAPSLQSAVSQICAFVCLRNPECIFRTYPFRHLRESAANHHSLFPVKRFENTVTVLRDVPVF